MFKLIAFFAILALAFALPEPKPQFYSGLGYAGYSGYAPVAYGAYGAGYGYGGYGYGAGLYY